MHKVTFITLGCKLNQAETAMLIQDFEDRGYCVVENETVADVGVINTCTVTGRSASKCRQAIRKLQKINPEMTLIVTGCYSQVDPEEVAELEGVDYILGVQEKLKLFEYFQAPGKKKQPLIAVQMVSETREADLHPVGNYQNQTRAFLKIQNGCDRRCAYCIVPIARGASRSVPKESVIEQAQKLIKEKFKEIVLTGVHVGDYGKEIHPERCSMLPQLLDELAAVSGNARFRISSTDPGDMTEELIEVIAQQSNICRHFHIPIQSGCNAVLKNMNRNYTVEYVADVIEQIQSKIGIVGLGADVIVGFPGETDEQFEETYQFIQNQLFSYLHVFPFSIRKGTAAAVMKNKVDSKIIAKRAQKLRQLGNEKKRQWLSQWNGKTVDVLLENRNLNGRMGGFTSEYARVEIPYQANLSNQLIPVKIIGQTSSILKGKIEEG